MIRMRRLRSSAVMAAAFCSGALAGCASDPVEDEPLDLAATQQGLVGDQLGGISAADFAEAKAAFATVEDIDDGLGPVFNEKGCGNCHTQGAIGGAGVQIERRFGRFVNGAFNSLANKGGSLR